MGPTMDHQIIRDLFAQHDRARRRSSASMRRSRAQLAEARARIAPNQIGRYGQLQEWLEDMDDPTNQHRHVSHLWGLHPGREITRDGTPELFAAARRSLIFRGDGGTGWSMAWKINFWARLLDGDHAHRLLDNLLTLTGSSSDGVQRRRRLSEPVRRASAVPDRRQLRRDRRNHRDARCRATPASSSCFRRCHRRGPSGR